MTPSERLKAELIEPYKARDKQYQTTTCLDGDMDEVSLLTPHSYLDDSNQVSVAFRMDKAGKLSIISTQHDPGGAFDPPRILEISGFNDDAHPLQAANSAAQQLFKHYKCQQLPVVVD